MVIRIIYVIILLMFSSCLTKSIVFIDVEKQISLINRKQIIKDSSFLKNGIYLNTNFYSELITLDSINMGKELFDIDQNDKKRVSLSKNYSNIKEIIEPIDSNLIGFFHIEFGIENPDKCILNKSLVYKNRIYVEFISDLGVNAFVLELIKSDVVVVETAFLLID